MSSRAWTTAQLDAAIAILRRHERVIDASAEITRVTGRSGHPKTLRDAFADANLPPPKAFLARSLDTERPAANDSSGVAPEVDLALDVDLGEFESSVRAGALLPMAPVPSDHRVKGNSTLVDGDGTVDRQWIKTERDSAEPTRFQPTPEGHFISKVSTLLDGQGKVRAQWIQAPKAQQDQFEQFWRAAERQAERHRGIALPTEAPTSAEDTLTVYPLGDPHIGMLSWHQETGEDFDLKIAERDLTRAVHLLVDRAPPSETAALVNLGDFFHAQDNSQLTPHGGNKLDCDSRSGKIVEIGFGLLRNLVTRLLMKHRFVRVFNVGGNHDPTTALYLRLWLKAVFENEPRVIVEENLNPFTYLTFGKNLIGFCHGDGPKIEELPAIMAADEPALWGESEFRTWLTGHVHHQVKKELRGCTVESFRTLAPKDYWHHHKGYRAGQSLSTITYHREFGEVSRSTVGIKLARTAA